MRSLEPQFCMSVKERDIFKEQKVLSIFWKTYQQDKIQGNPSYVNHLASKLFSFFDKTIEDDFKIIKTMFQLHQESTVGSIWTFFDRNSWISGRPGICSRGTFYQILFYPLSLFRVIHSPFKCL